MIGKIALAAMLLGVMTGSALADDAVPDLTGRTGTFTGGVRYGGGQRDPPTRRRISFIPAIAPTR